MKKRREIRMIRIKREKFFWIASPALLLLVLLYFTLLNATAFNAAKITYAQKEMEALNQEISNLEFELIELRNNLNLELAYSMGFEKTEDMKFIYRRSVATMLDTGNIE